MLPPKMDFFIMLSSVSSIIGNVGQANYAAGNTFEDALAHYHTVHNEKGRFSRTGLGRIDW
jgi:KR domain